MQRIKNLLDAGGPLRAPMTSLPLPATRWKLDPRSSALTTRTFTALTCGRRRISAGAPTWLPTLKLSTSEKGVRTGSCSTPRNPGDGLKTRSLTGSQCCSLGNWTTLAASCYRLAPTTSCLPCWLQFGCWSLCRPGWPLLPIEVFFGTSPNVFSRGWRSSPLGRLPRGARTADAFKLKRCWLYTTRSSERASSTSCVGPHAGRQTKALSYSVWSGWPVNFTVARSS